MLRVTGGVAVEVVDAFEVVDVDQQQGAGFGWVGEAWASRRVVRRSSVMSCRICLVCVQTGIVSAHAGFSELSG